MPIKLSKDKYHLVRETPEQDQSVFFRKNDQARLRVMTDNVHKYIAEYVLPYKNINTTRPVFITAFDKSHFVEGKGIIRMFHQRLLMHNYSLAIYDLGLTDQQAVLMQRNCKCFYRKLNFSHYPSHVKQLHNYAFKPIVIQEALYEFGFVFWMDASFRVLYSYDNEPLQALIDDVRLGSGVSTWPNRWLMACFIHPQMYEIFGEHAKDFLGKKSPAGGAVLLYNDPLTYQYVLLPWLSCALYESCIAPAGARLGGCKLENEKTASYCCHRYDQSALGITLFRAFHFNESLFFNQIKPHYYHKQDRTAEQYF